MLALARRTNIPIYAIGLGARDEATLSRLGKNSGGQYLPAPKLDELATLYKELGEQLAGQYTISYTSDLKADESERVVKLGVQKEGFEEKFGSKAFIPKRPEITTRPPGAPGSSFKTAIAIEPGKRYKLPAHLRDGEFAHHYVEAEEWQMIYASLRAGLAGVAFKDGRFESNPRITPHVGIAFHDADENELVYEEAKGVGSGFSYITQPALGDAARYYILIGCKTAAVAKGTEFLVEVGGTSGLGFDVGQTPAGWNVGKLKPRTPAEKAGVAAGDRILEIDGFPITGKTEAVSVLSRINRVPGATVKLKLFRPSTKETLELTIEDE